MYLVLQLELYTQALGISLMRIESITISFSLTSTNRLTNLVNENRKSRLAILWELRILLGRISLMRIESSFMIYAIGAYLIPSVGISLMRIERECVRYSLNRLLL